MSSDNTERPDDIKPDEVTSRAKTEFTFKDVIGITEGKELLAEIMEKVKRSTSGAGIDNITKIHKVPEIMLKNEEFKQNFKPSQLSIGPIHAADSDLFKKQLKLKLAAYFVKETNKSGEETGESGEETSKRWDAVLEEIKAEIKDIKTSFDKEVIESYACDDELICLLFLDGCAMLGFMHCFVNRRLKELSISNGQAAQQDFFLLENQIPFKILALLMGIGGSQSNYCRKIDDSKNYFFEFIIASNMINFPRDWKDLRRLFKKIYRDRNPVHVLDLLRDVITADRVCTFSCLPFVKLLLAIFCSCGLVIPLMICKRVCSKIRCENPKKWSKKQSFRSVQELKIAGIKFQKNDITLKEISFRFRFCVTGRLNLPTLVVNNSTQSMLLNLVAHEMCLSSSHPNCDPWITSYVNLLDLLVDNEQDVKDLRAANVLRNCLSSDIDVAHVINSIGSSCFAPSEDTYAYVKKKIQKHYRGRLAIWTDEVCRAHFSSPWTILALFASIVILVLTVIQTWCAVMQHNSVSG
ncbi:hypothetical protein TIFTF001_024480 [Ficus carica]|uniref:Uncharacterized protein n=1 Tax=Ficus carica TaxID=3494 RepID=A0AA88AY27_FICCA|nr:hypothetical protein TIFTF001_024480 [Ficus carica]